LKLNILHGTTAIQYAARTSSLMTIMRTTNEDSDHIDLDFDEDLSSIRKIMTIHSMEQKRQDSQISFAALSANDNVNQLSEDDFIEEYFSDEEYEMPLNDTQAVGRRNSTTEANNNLSPQRGKSYYP
jgi:hypothetical protein